MIKMSYGDLILACFISSFGGRVGWEGLKALFRRLRHEGR